MKPRLIGLAGPMEGEALALTASDVAIGRHASNQIVIREIQVSRHHAEIVHEAPGYTLRDLESRHGTAVNGQPITSHPLTHGDVIALGTSSFLFLEHETEPSGDNSPVWLDDSAFLARSTLTLDATAAHYRQPAKILGQLPPTSKRESALSLLLRAGSELGALRRVEELADRLMRFALEAVPAERAALLLTAPEATAFDPTFALTVEGEPSAPVAVSQTVALRVMRQKEALISNDIRQEKDLHQAASLRAQHVSSLLCVPLVTAEPSALGVLYLDDRRAGASFDEEDLRLAIAIAGIAAPAVANLRHLAWVDGERQRLQAESLDHDMVGDSEALSRVIDLITRVAPADTTVLVRGESGTGKELAARALHRGGERRDRPFVAINCATLSESLLESDLFGHEKGAFTGAVSRKIGKLEIAHTGTLFLDEIGELPTSLQAKLLRVLQEREFERVGGTRPIRVDVRIVAATNRDLETAIQLGSFREDLFYRLSVISIPLPPLRQRRGDVPLLAGYFAELHAAKLKRLAPSFAPAARQLLERYRWPGNVRELSNAIERALVLCPDDVVRPEDLPETLLETPEAEALATGSYHEVVRETKKRLIQEAVWDADGNITEAAKALGVHPNYLHRLIRNLDLRAEL